MFWVYRLPMNLSDFVQNFFICILKMNKSRMCLSSHLKTIHDTCILYIVCQVEKQLTVKGIVHPKKMKIILFTKKNTKEDLLKNVGNL